MIRIIILAAFVSLIACKGIEQIKEQSALLENLKTEVSALGDSIAVIKAQLDSLQANYETHLTKYHSGRRAPAPTPKPKPSVPPRKK